MSSLHQGDMLRLNNLKFPVLVVSKDFFNQTGAIIGCPVIRNGAESALHLPVDIQEFHGVVCCENMKLLDLRVKRFSRIGSIPMQDIINITDAIQGIFDYV